MKSLIRVTNLLNPLSYLKFNQKENRTISGGGTKIILKQIGNLFILLGFIFLVPGLVSLIYAEWYSTLGFILSSLIIFAIGFLLLAIFRKTQEPHFNHSFLVVAWGWLAMTFAGGLPFFLISVITPQNIMNGFIPEGVSYTSSSLLYFRNYLHCFFESMSAYTTTGLTMALHEPSVGKGILF